MPKAIIMFRPDWLQAGSSTSRKNVEHSEFEPITSQKGIIRSTEKISHLRHFAATENEGTGRTGRNTGATV